MEKVNVINAGEVKAADSVENDRLTKIIERYTGQSVNGHPITYTVHANDLGWLINEVQLLRSRADIASKPDKYQAGYQDLVGVVERIAASIRMSWCCTAETMELESRIRKLAASKPDSDDVEAALKKLREMFPESPEVDIRFARGRNGLLGVVHVYANSMLVGHGKDLPEAMQKVRERKGD